MAQDSSQAGTRGRGADLVGLPHPTLRYRRRSWLVFQQALDPLATPKPLPTRRLRPPPADG